MSHTVPFPRCIRSTAIAEAEDPAAVADRLASNVEHEIDRLARLGVPTGNLQTVAAALGELHVQLDERQHGASGAAR